MIYVEAGKFKMGNDDMNDAERQENECLHDVLLTQNYWIGKFPVTQEQYELVTGNNPSKFKNGSTYPVERVSWYDARTFCKKLNKKLSSNLPDGFLFNLPTEAQWEYAARGGKKNYGFNYSGEDNIMQVGWCEENSNEMTHPVGEKESNELGIFDMSGNVWEWCFDSCEIDSGVVHTCTYSGYNISLFRNPLNTKGKNRIRRGGSYISVAEHCRIAYRSGGDLSERLSCVGFRVVLTPKN